MFPLRLPGFSAALGTFLLLPVSSQGSCVCFAPLRDTRGLEGWAVEAGVAVITESSIGDFPLGSVRRAGGKSAGEVYSITASRCLGELRWEIGGHTFTPKLEIPLTLELVDQDKSETFFDYNASFAVRWVDFPWNKVISTSFMTGVGLSYSEEIYQVDRERHPGEDRSNLKFNWPIQLTLALPQYPKEQLTIYIAHHSGGHVFDVGGFNSLGVGYRHEF